MISRFIQRFALWIIGAWALAVIVGNAVAPQFEQVAAGMDQPIMPPGVPSSIAVQRSAAAFGLAASDNIGYVVLERNGPLEDRDWAFFERLAGALHADSRHVIDIVDWWREPATADAAVSRDHHAAIAMVRLGGMLGTTFANESTTAVRNTAAQLHPPDGLHVYFTGSAGTIKDEFEASGAQLQAITATTVAALLVLLFIVYRSLVTAMVPMVSVLVSVTAAKPVISLLVVTGYIGVSWFAIGLSVAVIMGAGSGFAIFLIGRYNEGRRQGFTSEEALADAYRGVAPAIIASVLIVVIGLGALGWLTLTRISLVGTTGALCSVGMLLSGLAALTFTPAIIAVAGRADLLKTPPRQRMRAQWRRVGVNVARWPGPILLTCGGLILALCLPLGGGRIAWDEAASTPAEAESSRGYQAVNRHFAPNQLLPDIVTIETDHDIRNPAGLIAIEQITGAIMTIPSVRMVQSASRLNGVVPKESTLAVPAVHFGDRLDDVAQQLASQPATFTDLDSALDEMTAALDSMDNGLQQGASGLGQVTSSARQMQTAVAKLRVSVRTIRDIFAPLPNALAEIQECVGSPLCSSVRDLVSWTDTVLDSATALADGVGQVVGGIAVSAEGLVGLQVPIAFNFEGAAAGVRQARDATARLKQQMRNSTTPIRELPSYLHNLAALFRGSPGEGLNIGLKALTDPNLAHILDDFYSPNGHVTRLFVYGDGDYWASEGSKRAGAILAAVKGATKVGALKPTAVELAGVGPALRDRQALAGEDGIFLGPILMMVVFVITVLLLTSLAAGLAVVITATASYLAALGTSVGIWQFLLGHNLHWSVFPVSFLVLVAVGSGYNLHVLLRIREELAAGSRVSIIRALGTTGGVATVAGIVFGVMMFALATSDVLSVAQIGVTVGVGLLLDTFVMRIFVLPAIVVSLGNWFWWPRRFITEPELEIVTA